MQFIRCILFETLFIIDFLARLSWIEHLSDNLLNINLFNLQYVLMAFLCSVYSHYTTCSICAWPHLVSVVGLTNYFKLLQSIFIVLERFVMQLVQ